MYRLAPPPFWNQTCVIGRYYDRFRVFVCVIRANAGLDQIPVHCPVPRVWNIGTSAVVSQGCARHSYRYHSPPIGGNGLVQGFSGVLTWQRWFAPSRIHINYHPTGLWRHVFQHSTLPAGGSDVCFLADSKIVFRVWNNKKISDSDSRRTARNN